MTLISKALLVASALIVTTPAMAAVQITNSQGSLTGATGVSVGSKLYNVEFVEGSCVSVFNGCNVSDFNFSTAEDARLAASALLDQVFVDTEKGQFDSNPSRTFGCTDNLCVAFIPYAVRASVNVGAAVNYSSSSTFADRADTSSLQRDTDTSNRSSSVYAKFSFVSDIPTPAVPEPTTWAMMLVGFGMIGAASRYRRRKTAIVYA